MRPVKERKKMEKNLDQRA